MQFLGYTHSLNINQDYSHDVPLYPETEVTDPRVL